VNGEKVNFKKPYDAVKKGICYLSEDRKRFCLLLEKSVAENTVLSSLENYIKHGFINDKKIISDAKEQNQRLKTKTTNINEKIKNLSGGNQQKVIIARWLLKNSDIFIFDEPTRGIDIGAKSDIYSLIKKLAEQNKSVIVISSEFNEIKNLADRVLVMSEGEITKELNIHEITQENIIKYSMKRA
jgi:ribose transport system ATP-binding protein